MPISVTLSCCRRIAAMPDDREGQVVHGMCSTCGGAFRVTVPWNLPDDEPGPAGPTLTGRALALFGCVVKAVVKGGLNPIIPGLPTGDILVEAWDNWHKQEAEETEKQKQVAALAGADPDEVRRQAETIVAALASGLPPDARERLVAYLAHIPNTVRRSMSAAAPGGPDNAEAPAPALRRADDLAALLPGRMPRFRPGDRPPGIGDWHLTEWLGSGEFGEVWKAENPHLASARPVALKFCLDPTAAAGLRDEAGLLDRVMRQGRHPGIVPLLHTYLSADPPCLEYELVEGGDLAGLVRNLHTPPAGPGPILVERATELMTQLAGAVAFAHRLDPPIVHRDLQPTNVLVQRAARGKVTLRVGDFGIAGLAPARSRTGRAGSAGSTAPARGSYTPLYASPQQVRGGPPDPADDVYALGVIWWQMLTGDLTAGCPTGSKWAARLAGYGMSPPLVELLGACVEADRADRPANAGVVADRLAAIRRATPAAPAATPAAGAPVTFEGHTNWVNAAVCSADGRVIVTGGADKTVRVFDAATREELRCLKGHTKTVRSVAVSADGTRVISGSYDHTARTWDVATGRQVGSFEGHASDVMAVAFLPGGLALSGSKDHTARTWNAKTGKEVLKLGGAAIGPVWFAAPSPDGTLALTNGPDTALALWDLTTGDLVRLFEGHTEWVWAAAFSPDGRLALSAGSDKAVVLWGVESGREVARFKAHTKSVWGVGFSPDGKLAVSGGYDSTVRVWEVASGREVHRFEGHAGYVLSVAFAPGGQRVLSASRDKTARLWSLPSARS